MPPDMSNQPGPSRERTVERKREPSGAQTGAAAAAAGGSSNAAGSGTGSGSGHKDRIGDYHLGGEIGRGSFATVYKGYKSKSRIPIAIKAVSRQKLTAKLLENLESEINILKSIHNRNIVALLDCFKNDTSIYLVMEFCSGSDLSVYIKNRGKLETLDFVPRNSIDGRKIFWPHPVIGGLDERVTRHFLGQLALALRFLRGQNLIHRDIKPQNLLMQPATSAELSDGHPLGIPVLKVADFGFARILPAAAMAETLCGSPLYMAPEILRYEKYDAKADLWSVGAVLFEMTCGKPPFRASNHVELLRKIEKGEDRIKFPDESKSSTTSAEAPDAPPPPEPVSPDIKALIRGLLKRKPLDRMTFDDFFACGVWDGWMLEENSENEGGQSSYDVSTESSSAFDDSASGSGRMKELVKSMERSQEGKLRPTRAPQPLAEDPAMNPRPAPRPPVQVPRRSSTQPQPSQPKYYVSETPPPLPPTQSTSPTGTNQARASPRPISAMDRRPSQREAHSLEDQQVVTPSTGPATQVALPPRHRLTTEGSPLAATPPFTLARDGDTGRGDSALTGSDSMVGREYVVVEKGQVEVNKLADELEHASRKPALMTRRPSSRTSIVSRPVSSFKPISGPGTSPTATTQQALVPLSYSPPFALGTTPPFAIPPSVRRSSTSISRTPSIPQSLNAFPPTSGTSQGYPHQHSHETYHRYGSSPSSYQTGALARAFTNTAIRLIGSSANSAATALVRAASKRRPTITRMTEVDPAEDELLLKVEDLARKAFVLFELADTRLVHWQRLGSALQPPQQQLSSGNTPPFSGSGRRKSSSSSTSSELNILRQQETAAGEGVMLYAKAMSFITLGTQCVKSFVDDHRGYSDGVLSFDNVNPSPELVEIASWLRHRFNECLEKIEWAKDRCADELPFVDRMIHDKAREYSRHAALVELEGGYVAAEAGYENALWLLQVLLDDHFYEDGKIKDEDKAGVEKLLIPIRYRLDALRKKMDQVPPSSPIARD